MSFVASISTAVGGWAVAAGASAAVGAAVGGAVAGAVVGAVVSGITAALTGGNILKGMLVGGLVGAAVGGIGGYLSAPATSGVTAGTEAVATTGAEVGSTTVADTTVSSGLAGTEQTVSLTNGLSPADSALTTTPATTTVTPVASKGMSDMTTAALVSGVGGLAKGVMASDAADEAAKRAEEQRIRSVRTTPVRTPAPTMTITKNDAVAKQTTNAASKGQNVNVASATTVSSAMDYRNLNPAQGATA